MPRAHRTSARPGRRPSSGHSVHSAPALTEPGLPEDPHAHIVCRVCGRIQPVDLNELDRHLLTELAALRPEGWSVEQIAYSLTGACRRCRQGPNVH